MVFGVLEFYLLVKEVGFFLEQSGKGALFWLYFLHVLLVMYF